MSTETHKALLRRYYHEVLSQGNLALIPELFAPDLVERFTGAVTASRTAFPDLYVTVEDQLAEGDRVATRFTARGMHRGPFLGVAPTDKQVILSAIHIHRIENGQIAELWEEINLLSLLQQIGAIKVGSG
jgi:steroid delta-isomerase-like uncharacterized protein